MHVQDIAEYRINVLPQQHRQQLSTSSCVYHHIHVTTTNLQKSKTHYIQTSPTTYTIAVIYTMITTLILTILSVVLCKSWHILTVKSAFITSNFHNLSLNACSHDTKSEIDRTLLNIEWTLCTPYPIFTNVQALTPTAIVSYVLTTCTGNYKDYQQFYQEHV